MLFCHKLQWKGQAPEERRNVAIFTEPLEVAVQYGLACTATPSRKGLVASHFSSRYTFCRQREPIPFSAFVDKENAFLLVLSRTPFTTNRSFTQENI